ncbi:hypothetical protein BH18THE1_BH18THE1_05120 [soil metagenome]
MADLLHEIREEYLLYTIDRRRYEKKVNSISDMFGLTRKNRFKTDYCAVYVVGRFQCAPIIMFGLNPGYSSRNSPIEENEARKSWEDYQNLYLNFFKYFSHNKFESPYYTALWYLLSGLTGTHFPKKRKWELFDQYLCNLELIPYHSEGVVLPAILNEEQLEYLQNRYNSSIKFIRQFKPKLLIFNGKIWKNLLNNHNLIEQHIKAPITDQFRMYFFELDGIPSVLFDRFFQRHFGGITNEDRMFTIPKVIHSKFENLSNNLSLS